VWPGLNSRERLGIFLFSTGSIPPLGFTKPPIKLVLLALYPKVKRQKREAKHSPPSSSEVKNGGAIPPLSYMSHWHSA
jgi:hypothetical protein